MTVRKILALMLALCICAAALVSAGCTAKQEEAGAETTAAYGRNVKVNTDLPSEAFRCDVYPKPDLSEKAREALAGYIWGDREKAQAEHENYFYEGSWSSDEDGVYASYDYTDNGRCAVFGALMDSAGMHHMSCELDVSDDFGKTWRYCGVFDLGVGEYDFAVCENGIIYILHNNDLADEPFALLSTDGGENFNYYDCTDLLPEIDEERFLYSKLDVIAKDSDGHSILVGWKYPENEYANDYFLVVRFIDGFSRYEILEDCDIANDLAESLEEYDEYDE